MFLCYFYSCVHVLFNSLRYLFIISTSAIDYHRRFVSEMTSYVSTSGILNLNNVAVCRWVGEMSTGDGRLISYKF